MKIQPYIDKLSNSSQFKDFQKKNQDAFMVAGFFILDLEEGKNLHQIDYYVPSKKKIAAFTLDKQVTLQLLDLLNSKTPEKLDSKTSLDLEAIPGLLKDEMKNRNITESIKKIIAVLQTIEGKKVWSLNCILSGMGILNAHVDDSSQTILKMEKKNLMDFMQKMPAAELKKQMQDQQQVQIQNSEHPMTQDSIQDQIKKLNDLEVAIEKEKSILSKEAEKAPKISKTDKSDKVQKTAKSKKSQ